MGTPTRLPRWRPRLPRAAALLGAIAFVLLTGVGMALAQSVASGTIHGTVRDNTGGALPGVTVTLASAALQVRQLVNTTGAEGNYRFVDLPAGTYQLKFELPGFRPFVRDEFRLNVGFVARVDAVMEVGGIEESVTVSGQSPVVDMTSTSTSVAFTREVLEEVPRGRDLQHIFAMAPGVTEARPDVGGSQMAIRQNVASYGVTASSRSRASMSRWGPTAVQASTS